MTHVLRRVLSTAIGVFASTNLAFADDKAIIARSGQDRIHVVPFECRQYTVIPASARDITVEWQQAISLAACIQGGPASMVQEPEQLGALVEEMTWRLELPMTIYLEVLASAPPPIQLRAAFHIGLAQVALSTRARSSIAAPPDLATNVAAEASYRALHARLEPLLVRSRRAAWISFKAIDEAAAENPELAADAVSRNMIRTAREMLDGLRDVAQVRASGNLR